MSRTPTAIALRERHALEDALIAECERAMKQRDEFLRTGVSTAACGGSHDTCFGYILRKFAAPTAEPALMAEFERQLERYAEALTSDDFMSDHEAGRARNNVLQMHHAALAAAPQSAPTASEREDTLRRALEIIAVGDSKNPQLEAAEELIALGYWRDIPEARSFPESAPSAEPALGSLEQWEAEAEAFYAATGYLRPGKDYGALSCHDNEREALRNAAWRAWAGGRNYAAKAAQP